MANNENSLIKKLKYRNFEMYKYFQKALEILSILNEKAYEAYIVGGAVRDLYLECDFNDIDIATNATPQAIKNIFTNCDVDMQYEHLGSVVLKIDNFRYEITTFRSEEYVKHRLKSVHYSKKLIDDIQRRDFTINALAMSLNQNVIDVVKGEKDLYRKTIKVIGKGTKRFKDDPTRILRAIHLVSKLNFKIDSRTEHAMIKTRHLLNELSNYKLITLLNKILNEKYSSNAIKTIKRLNLFKEMPKYNEWIKIISKTKKLNYIEEFTILFKLINDIPLNTGFSHKENVEIKKLFELSEYMFNNQITPIDIIQIGLENLIQADNILTVMNKKYISQSKQIKKMNKKMPIHSARELKISVDEIKNLLNGDNSKISMITNELLLLVVNGVIKNKYSELEDAALLIIEGKESNYKTEESFNPFVNQVEENERIIALLERNKESIGKVGEVIEQEISQNISDEKTNEIIDIDNSSIENNKLIENVKIDMNELEDEKTLENVNVDNSKYDDKNLTENIKSDICDLDVQYIDEIDFSKKQTSIDETNAQDNINNILDENKLVQMFYEDFNELYRIHRKSVFDDLVVSNLNEDEINKQEIIIKEDVKRILIEKNQNYKYLNDRGII